MLLLWTAFRVVLTKSEWEFVVGPIKKSDPRQLSRSLARLEVLSTEKGHKGRTPAQIAKSRNKHLGVLAQYGALYPGIKYVVNQSLP